MRFCDEYIDYIKYNGDEKDVGGEELFAGQLDSV